MKEGEDRKEEEEKESKEKQGGMEGEERNIEERSNGRW